MGIESAAASFLSGFASTYGKETPESRALKEMAFAKTLTGIKYSQYKSDTVLAHQARVREGQRKILTITLPLLISKRQLGR